MRAMTVGRVAARRDHLFQIGMALAIAMTVIGGFGSFAMRGLVDIPNIPFWVHMHAVLFIAWTLLFVVQTVLAQRGAIVLHRLLGWTAAGLAMVMTPLAMATALLAVRFDRVPAFFPHEIFIALNLLEVAAFGGLFIAAIRSRKRTQWHKRLMLCAMLSIIGPAFGRILPMPLLGPWGGLAVMLCQLAFVIVGIGYDRLNRGRVHPAYWVGGAVIAIEGLAVPLLAAAPPVIWLTRALSPG